MRLCAVSVVAHLGACDGSEEGAAVDAPRADASAPCSSCTGGDAALTDSSLAEEAAPSNAQIGAPSYGGCKLFPDNNIFNTQITNAPIHAQSATWLAHVRSASAKTTLGQGASALVYDGSRGGIPINIGGIQRTLALDGSYGQPLDSFTTRMPAEPRIEGEPSPIGAWDKHVLVIDPDSCMLFEHINYRYDILRSGFVTTGSVGWDLKTNLYSTPLVKGGAGAEAAGIPMAPLIYRYDEVKAGEIRHPIRAAGDFIGEGKFVWPARASDGRDKDSNALPMGARLRLRANTDLSGLGPSAKVIAKALMTYGMIISDSTLNGFGLCGEGDERWDDKDLGTIGTLDFNQFDVVDTEGWRVSNESMEAHVK